MSGKSNTSISIHKSENFQGWMSVIPVILIILAIRGYPIVVGILKSFTNWDGLFRSDFVGLRNYISILGSSQFWMLLKNNIVLLLYLPAQIAIGLIVAVLLYEEIPGWKFFRSCYYLPQVLSVLSIGYLFVVCFGYDGPVNTILRKSGLGVLAVDWLGSGSTGLLVIITCMVWINIGWQGMLFLGGMANIQPSIYEAAVIDGAGYWTKLMKITFPLLIRTVEYSVIVSVLWTFTSLFPLIFSITKGGPGYETTTVDYMIYLRAFKGGSDFGYASALAVILLLIVLALTVLQMKLTKKSEDWSE